MRYILERILPESSELVKMENFERVRLSNFLVENNATIVMLNRISEYFRLGPIKNFNRVGGINKNFSVTTDTGEFIFKILIYSSLEALQKEIVYLKQLKTYHYPIPSYLSPDDHSFALQGEGFIAIVMPKLPGQIEKPSNDINRQIGFYQAQLHCIPIQGLPYKKHWLSKDYLQSLLKFAEMSFEKEATRFTYMYETLSYFNPNIFPQSIIHGDLHPDNCLFINNELSTVLDWEDVGIGACIMDFAWSILSFCFIKQLDGKRNFDQELYSDLYDHYSQIRNFTFEEKKNIKNAIKYMGLTFCLWKWLQKKINGFGDTKASLDYFDLAELNALRIDKNGKIRG